MTNALVAYKIILLLTLQYLIDKLYVFLYPNVSPLRAALIGLSAFALLSFQYLAHSKFINPATGALSIYSNALFGALLIQSHYLISKSFLSGLFHASILIISYILLEYFYKKYKITLI